MGNGYPLCINIPGQLYFKKVDMYWPIENNAFPGILKYNTQCQYDPTNQKLIMHDSSESS